MMKSPDRLMFFTLSYTTVLHIALPFDTWRRVDDVNLPDDIKILSVHLNPRTRRFEFLISSETFERLAEGCEPPLLELNLQIKEHKGDDS